jgi:hypothetical protein
MRHPRDLPGLGLERDDYPALSSIVHGPKAGGADLLSKVCGCSVVHKPKAADLDNRFALPGYHKTHPKA